jgi:hypothetical protein
MISVIIAPPSTWRIPAALTLKSPPSKLERLDSELVETLRCHDRYGIWLDMSGACLAVAVAGSARARREPDALGLGQQVIGPQVAVNLRDQCRAALVANQHRNLGIGQPALAALRHEIATQPVRRDMPDAQRFAGRPNAPPDGRNLTRLAWVQW